MKYDKKISPLKHVISVLNKILEENMDNFKKGDFKVRPGYAYDKFYIDQVDGSYDMSLYGLIHHIMFEDYVYDSFLNDKQLKECEKVSEKEPESIWRPNDDDPNYDEVQDKLDEIYNGCKSFVGEKLEKNGITLESYQDDGW